MSWQETQRFVTSGPTALFLGSAAYSPPSSPTAKRPPAKKVAPGSRAIYREQPELVLASVPFSRLPSDAAPGEASAVPLLFYFEVFVKTTGGGLHPSGSVGVGLAEASQGEEAAAEEADASFTPSAQASAEPSGAGRRRVLHYHSGKGGRFSVFPRSTARAGLFGTEGRQCGPSFGVGDTVGCGWCASGTVFFTFNGRHLGNAFTDVWGTMHPAVDVDMPGACLELTTGMPGERSLKYAGDGNPTSATERVLKRLIPSRDVPPTAVPAAAPPSPDLGSDLGTEHRGAAEAAEAAETARVAALGRAVIEAEAAELLGGVAGAALQRLSSLGARSSPLPALLATPPLAPQLTPQGSCTLAATSLPPDLVLAPQASRERSTSLISLRSLSAQEGGGYEMSELSEAIVAGEASGGSGGSAPSPPPSAPLDRESAEHAIALLEELLEATAAPFAAHLAGRLPPEQAALQAARRAERSSGGGGGGGITSAAEKRDSADYRLAHLGSSSSSGVGIEETDAAEGGEGGVEVRARASYVRKVYEGMEVVREMGRQCEIIQMQLAASIEQGLHPPASPATPLPLLVEPSGCDPGAVHDDRGDPEVEVEAEAEAEVEAGEEDEGWTAVLPRRMSSFDKEKERESLRREGTAGGTAGGTAAAAAVERASPPKSSKRVRMAEEYKRLSAVLALADHARESEVQTAEERQWLIATYERCVQLTTREGQWRQLEALLQARLASPASPASAQAQEAVQEAMREAVQETVLLAASAPCQVQLCAAALLARLCETADGAKQVHSKGGHVHIYSGCAVDSTYAVGVYCTGASRRYLFCTPPAPLHPPTPVHSHPSTHTPSGARRGRYGSSLRAVGCHGEGWGHGDAGSSRPA